MALVIRKTEHRIAETVEAQLGPMLLTLSEGIEDVEPMRLTVKVQDHCAGVTENISFAEVLELATGLQTFVQRMQERIGDT